MNNFQFEKGVEHEELDGAIEELADDGIRDLPGLVMILTQVKNALDGDPATVCDWNTVLAGLGVMGLGLCVADADKSSVKTGVKILLLCMIPLAIFGCSRSQQGQVAADLQKAHETIAAIHAMATDPNCVTKTDCPLIDPNVIAGIRQLQNDLKEF